MQKKKSDQNSNRRMLKNNTSGEKNISREPKRIKEWVVRIERNGKRKYVGSFVKKADAVVARDEFIKNFHQKP